MANGSSGDELERIGNFYTGAEENPTSAQSAPTPRAQQSLMNIGTLPDGDPFFTQTPFIPPDDDGPAPFQTTPYNPGTDVGNPIQPVGNTPKGQGNGGNMAFNNLLMINPDENPGQLIDDGLANPALDPGVVPLGDQPATSAQPEQANNPGWFSWDYWFPHKKPPPAPPGITWDPDQLKALLDQMDAQHNQSEGGLPRYHGQTTSQAAAAAVGLIVVEFPMYAGKVALDVATVIGGPEELTALKLAAEAKGLVVGVVKRGAKEFLVLMKKGATNADDLVAELKTVLAQMRNQRLHHAWPKYLGGRIKQELEKLPKWLHDAYHAGLDKMLPRQVPGGATRYYASLSPARQQANFEAFRKYTMEFDKKYGTKLWEAALREGLPQ
jgi:hypothetical protein